jgi:hypothetical protein
LETWRSPFWLAHRQLIPRDSFFFHDTMLPEFAHSLYQSFEREGIPLLLAGGWAVCHHGYGHTKVSDEEFRALCERYAGPAAYDKIKSNP